MNRIEVSYNLGKATVKLPGKGKKKALLAINLTIDEAKALARALEQCGMWAGTGYTHYDWPEPAKRGKKKEATSQS